jgi:hypothetical protein
MFWSKTTKIALTATESICNSKNDAKDNHDNCNEPERPESYSEREFKRDMENISQAIRVLKMTDQTEVNASTYKSVAEYL